MASNVLSGLWIKVVQVVKMVISTPQAVADMEDQAQRLDNVIHGINEKLDQEQKSPKRIVEFWVNKADEAIKSSRSIGNDYQQQKNCLGWCPNCFCRYRISKDIIDWRLKVDQLHQEKLNYFPLSDFPLSEEEAWQLFCSRAFGNESVPQEIEDIARGIAGECKGLPLAINVVAAAMANYKYSHEWELGLSQIQNIDERFYGLHNEIEEKLFQRLKWSYNGLQDDLKTCFVYFAAYPEDKKINCEEVIDIWIAEGLLKERGEIYLRDIGHSYINFLRDRCLIEVVSNDIVGRVESVKIHDILRDLAILIAEKEHGCYFKAGQGLRDFPSEEDSEGCARMSLMKNGLHSLPTTFRCSSLSVLLLRENKAIKEIPGSFLNELPSLRVLDLSETGITSLPSCIGNLKHLASLQLGQTGITELPETICGLKKLQFLDVSRCEQLRCLPERIGELKSLRALDINRCPQLSHLPRGSSELVTLERLTMWGYSSIVLDFESMVV